MADGRQGRAQQMAGKMRKREDKAGQDRTGQGGAGLGKEGEGKVQCLAEWDGEGWGKWQG